MADEILVQYKVEVAGMKAELKDLQAKLKDVEGAAKKSADTAQKEFKSAGDSIKGIGKEIAVSLGLAFGVAKVIEFGKESLKAFIDAEESANKLRFALTKIGSEGEAAFKKLIEQSKKLESISIFSDDDIQKAQTQLAQFGLNSKQIEKLIPQILDLASATGQDLGSATSLSIQGINGLTRGLKAVGAEFKDTGDKTKNLSLLQEKLAKFAGASGEALETTGGKAKAFSNAVNNIQEDVGEFIVEAATPLVEILAFMLNGFESTAEGAEDFADSIKLSDEELKKFNNSAIELQISLQKNLIRTLEEAGGQGGSIQKATQELAKLEAQLFRSKSSSETDEGLLNQVKELDKALESKFQLKVDGLTNADKKRILEEIIAARNAANTNNLGLTGAGEAEFEAAKAAAKTIADKTAADNLKRQQDEDARLLKLSADGVKERAKMLSDQQAVNAKKEEDSIAAANERKKQQEKDFNDEVAAIKKEGEAKITQDKADAIAARERLEQESVAAIQSILGSIAQINSNISQSRINEVNEQADAEIAALERQYNSDLISKEQYESKKTAINEEASKKEADLKREAFEFQKNASLIQATIATAQGIATALTGDPYTVIARVAIAAAIGAAQIALIASQPTPKFEDGGKVGGKRHSSGGTLIEAEKDEWVINRNEAIKNNSLLKAINSGKTDKFILENYIAPALRAQQKKHSESKSQSFADNLSKSMILNSGSFKDGNLLESLKQSRKNDREIALFLAKELKTGIRNPRKF